MWSRARASLTVPFALALLVAGLAPTGAWACQCEIELWPIHGYPQDRATGVPTDAWIWWGITENLPELTMLELQTANREEVLGLIPMGPLGERWAFAARPERPLTPNTRYALVHPVDGEPPTVLLTFDTAAGPLVEVPPAPLVEIERTWSTPPSVGICGISLGSDGARLSIESEGQAYVVARAPVDSLYDEAVLALKESASKTSLTLAQDECRNSWPTAGAERSLELFVAAIGPNGARSAWSGPHRIELPWISSCACAEARPGSQVAGALLLWPAVALARRRRRDARAGSR